MKKKEMFRLIVPVVCYLFFQYALKQFFMLAGSEPAEAGAWGSIFLSLFLLPVYVYVVRKKGGGRFSFFSGRFGFVVPVLQGICLAIATHGYDTGTAFFTPVVIAGTGVAGPIVEEMIYRGYVQQTGNSLWGERKSLVFSTLLFSVAHRTPSGMLMALPAGFIFGVSMAQNETLLSPILIHVTTNVLSFVLPGERYPFPVAVLFWGVSLLLSAGYFCLEKIIHH